MNWTESEFAEACFRACNDGHCAHSFYMGEIKQHLETIETKGWSAVRDLKEGGLEFESEAA